MNPCQLEILTEEPSMEYFLRGLLPRILPADYQLDVNCHIRTHQGKSDLQKSLLKKMAAYPRFPYPVKVLVVHDQDSNDCLVLKAGLCDMLVQEPTIKSLVRIACKELENWYLGDFDGLQQVMSGVKTTKFKQKAIYRNPDNVFGAFELQKISPGFSKAQMAKAIGPIINITGNTSSSFKHFITGLHKLLCEL